MLHLFRRLFDAIEYRKQEAENRRKRELPPDVDRHLVLDLLVAPLFYRAYVSRESLDDAYFESLVDSVIRAVS